MNKEAYGKFAERHAPRSLAGKNLLWSFGVGGLICCLGQLFLGIGEKVALDRETAGTAASVTLVLLGALLTGLGVYDKIARYAGAGTLVPITGFANSVVAPALEFKTEGFITGTAVKMFSIAGPVIVFGVSASVLYGLLLCLLGAV